MQFKMPDIKHLFQRLYLYLKYFLLKGKSIYRKKDVRGIILLADLCIVNR